MINSANEFVEKVKVNRTITSPYDTLAGILGEYAFAQYYYGDWRKNNVGNTKGRIDFKNFEIKTSAFPFSEKLNLLVREDYALKRQPPYYVQVILDINNTQSKQLMAGIEAIICGYASHEDVMNAPKKDFGSKLADKGNYQCYYIPVAKLKPVSELMEK